MGVGMGVCGCFGKLVPGTDLLADIASCGPTVKGGKIVRKLPVLFKCPIGDALSGVEHTGFDKSLSRTCAKTGRAGTASVR